MAQTVALIGYGTASVNAAIALRCAGYQDRILVLSNTTTLPYSPVMTSYYAAATIPYEACFPWSSDDLASLNLDVRQGVTVTQLDVPGHRIVTDQGEYEYTKCLIATGATPASDPVFGEDVPAPFVLRTLNDAQRLKDALEDPSCNRVLVSGTSLIAMKAVEACLEQGVEVTLLGRSEQVLGRIATEEIAEAFQAALMEKGVDLRLSQIIEEVEPAEGQQGTRVTFSNGDVADYDAVLVAHGVLPNVQFVAEGALACDKGLIVDELMRTSDADVYAAGDVAQTACLASDQSAIAGLWKEAAVQGACAGRAMAAALAAEPCAPAGYAGFMPSNTVTVCDAVVVSAGSVALNPQRWSETVQRNACLVCSVFEQDPETMAVSLVGFNVFSNSADPQHSAAYDEGAMLYRRLMA